MFSARRVTTAVSTAVVLTTAGTLLTVTPASAATTCTSPVFKRQFFANTSFSGTPKKTDCDNAIDQNWGTGAPASGLPSNNFGVRWSVTRDFGSGGPFALAASGLDGIRVHVDGVRKIDLWKNTSTTVSKTVNVTIPSGKHTLRIDYVNWTGSAKVKFTYTPRTSATVDKVKPLTPTGASATYNSETTNIQLAWAKNKEMDLAGYRVHRRLKGTPYGSKPLTTTTSTSYKDATLGPTGEAYYYEIRAIDKAGNESGGTADMLVTTVDRTAPDAPTGFHAKVTPGAATLSWDTDDVTSTYRVYRATAPAGPFTRIADGLDSAWYRDGEADLTKRLYYRATAVDPVGNESAPSAVADTGEPDTTAPDQVTGVTVEGTTAGNAVRWQASSSTDVHHYEVWAAPEGGSDADGPETVYGLTFNDVRAEAGVTLTYRVQAVDWYGNLAPVSDPVTATRPAPGAVAAPTGLAGDPLDSATALTWDASADATGYRVYRRTDRNAAWTRLGDGPTTATRYSDTEAPGIAADYYVVALDAQGRESAPSDSVQVWRETPATPTAPAAPTITLSAPYTQCTANDCVAHGGTGVPLTVTLQHERLLSGYTYRFYGASNTGYVTTEGSTVTWTPTAPGLYVFEVRAIDYYGRSGPFGSVTFKVA